MSERKREVKSRRGGRRGRPPTRRRKLKPNVKVPRAFPEGKMSAAPVVMSKTRRTNKPAIFTKPNGDCRIRHREYIAEVTAGATNPSVFKVTQYAINPGQAATFPWLSRISANYESYVFEELRFKFETEAPTSLGGSLVLAVDYDASDPEPTSKQQAMTYRSSVRSAPWAPCEHRSLPEDLHKSKTNFVRINAQPNGTDIKTFDIGNLYVISQGVLTGGSVLGELYVEYVVNLLTPVYESVAGVTVAGGRVLNNGTTTPANPFGDGVGHVLPSTVGIAMDNASNMLFSQPGQYVVTCSVAGTGITSLVATAVSPDINVLSVQFAISGTTLAVRVFRVIVAAPGIVSFDNTGNATTITGASAFIGQMPFGS
jgi:hypothetical protein